MVPLLPQLNPTICLVVDADQDAREILARIVKNYFACEVRTASSPKEALYFIARKLPNLILLDWSLPHVSAFKLISLIRQTRLEYEPCIVMCIDETDEAKIRAVLKQGVTGYLVKPFTKAAVLSLLSRLGLRMTVGAVGSTNRPDPKERH
jgi:two-component system chemotaxis response regulator CheY